MSDEKKLNEYERTYEGCYGSQVKCDRLINFMLTNFKLNDMAQEAGQPRFAQCIWGHPGTGKTALVKELRNVSVEWNGNTYDGYDVRDVPIAQFEEMGDLHGLPTECYMMRTKDENGEEVMQWVHKNTIEDHKELGWELVVGEPTRMMYAPPDWVPLRPGPSVLLLDDWNRASIRIIKGCMQLLQNYGMVSWKLPEGCNIVLTGNPDEQDYLVTTIDSAIITRIKHITLKEDAALWAEWATAQKLDNRGISWVLYQPEMMCGKERTNPRTLSEFFRYLTMAGDLQDNDVRKDVLDHAHALLDDETVNAFIVFCTRDMEDVIEPLDILDGKKGIKKRVGQLMDRKEPRTDILGVTMERLFATMVDSDTEQTDDRIKHFQSFITMDFVPEDARHSLCNRLSRRPDDDGRNQKWLLGNTQLREQILDMLR